MATISCFEDMENWQLARQQAHQLFQIFTTGNFAKDFELRNQINSSSGSIMDIIAEGFERSRTKEFFNFLVIAKESNGEVDHNSIELSIEKILLVQCLKRNWEK